MKSLTTLTLTGLLCGFCLSASGQQIVTFDAGPWDGTNATIVSFEVPADQAAEILNCEPLINSFVSVNVYRNGQPVTSYSAPHFQDGSGQYVPIKVVSGPARIDLYNQRSYHAYCTLKVTPNQFPPGKTAVIGERDGPMKCTLEESTDLVNWTDSTSGQTHSLTNANAKKFFRIKLEQDVGP